MIVQCGTDPNKNLDLVELNVVSWGLRSFFQPLMDLVWFVFTSTDYSSFCNEDYDVSIYIVLLVEVRS